MSHQPNSGFASSSIWSTSRSRADGAIKGYEALVRWRHPVRGLVPPREFIPIAEQSRSIAQIDDWILMEVKEAASSDEPLRIAVNVSAVQSRR